MIVLAVDPGKQKCGIAVVSEKNVLKRMVVGLAQTPVACEGLCQEYKVDRIIVGSGTGSQGVVLNLRSILGREVTVVDEKHSTEQAKMRYFSDNPPKGLKKLIPLSLQDPPVQIDDYAAVVLAEKFIEDYMKRQSKQQR
ncbi:MAG: Holliday junction resolvase RuvX [bacterium]|nr:Holliday junction resolvase RuvX [bacterium]